MMDDTAPIGSHLAPPGGRIDSSLGGWRSAPGDTRAGDPPSDSAVESSPARPGYAMNSTDLFLARLHVERAVLSLRRRTAGREPTRAERRLQAHYERQLRALPDDTDGEPQ